MKYNIPVAVTQTKNSGAGYYCPEKGDTGILLQRQGGPCLWQSKNGRVTYVEGLEFTPLPAREALVVRRTLRRNKAVAAGISLGSDPEVMVLVDGRVLPAWKFLPKKTSRATGEQFWDGFQAEFTIEPSGCISFVVDAVQDGLGKVLAKARDKHPTAKLTHECVVEVPREEMELASDEHSALGCAPSSNIYGEEALSVPDPRSLALRFAGCHVHIGIGKIGVEDATPIVKALDQVIGILGTSLLAGLEDGRRRIFYGKAGEYRLPPHGIEYRVPSSAWLVHPVAMHLLFELARSATLHGALGLPIWGKTSSSKIRAIINECDVGGARKLMTQTLLENSLRYLPMSVQHKARILITTGVKELLPLDMEKNWYIGRKWMYHSESANCSISKVKL